MKRQPPPSDAADTGMPKEVTPCCGCAPAPSAHPLRRAGAAPRTLTLCNCLRMWPPAPTPSRLVILFQPNGSCGRPAGFEFDDLSGGVDGLPPALANAGVSRASWATTLQALHRDVLPLAMPAACVVATVIPYCYPFITGPVCLLQARYYRALRRWVDIDLNGAVLAPLGLYAAFQSIETREHCFSLPGPGLTRSWLAIALTREESLRLKAEPMLWTPVAVLSCNGDGSLQPHPAPWCVDFPGFCGTPCVV